MKNCKRTIRKKVANRKQNNRSKERDKFIRKQETKRKK